MDKRKNITSTTKKSRNLLLDDVEMKIKRDLTSAEERETFLYTNKINSARIFAKYLY